VFHQLDELQLPAGRKRTTGRAARGFAATNIFGIFGHTTYKVELVCPRRALPHPCCCSLALLYTGTRRSNRLSFTSTIDSPFTSVTPPPAKGTANRTCIDLRSNLRKLRLACTPHRLVYERSSLFGRRLSRLGEWFLVPGPASAACQGLLGPSNRVPHQARPQQSRAKVGDRPRR
jgi:hypothetical protein